MIGQSWASWVGAGPQTWYSQKYNRANSWATTKESGKVAGRVGAYGREGPEGGSLSFQVSSLEAEARPESRRLLTCHGGGVWRVKGSWERK